MSDDLRRPNDATVSTSRSQNDTNAQLTGDSRYTPVVHLILPECSSDVQHVCRYGRRRHRFRSHLDAFFSEIIEDLSAGICCSERRDGLVQIRRVCLEQLERLWWARKYTRQRCGQTNSYNFLSFPVMEGGKTARTSRVEPNEVIVGPYDVAEVSR